MIKEGEIAREMYFILKGVVHILTGEGTVLAHLSSGSNFGEMALVQGKTSLRNASAYCATHVSAAILTLEDFSVICEAYPEFYIKIKEEVRKREE